MTEQIRVLLAERDARTAKSIAAGLRAAGIDTVPAGDADTAMSLASREKFDAVIVSAELAGGGPEALRRLRSSAHTAHLPLIALAAQGLSSRQMRTAGARECVAVPAAPDKIAAAVRRNLLEELDFTAAPQAAIQAPERLRDLRDSGLLDTPPEKSFDLLTRLAASLCRAPTALVSLVDKDRQFFKSQTGLAEPWASERQTRLSHSFCQWVVSSREPVVVGDATEHPVLKSNLAVRDLGVIAYAGMPITGRRGQAIGSFCAIDSKKRPWSEEELATLRDLGRIAQAYAVLGEARHTQATARALSAAANLPIAANVAGNAILGAAHVLRRYGNRLADADRAALLEIIEEQAAFLAREERFAPAR